MLCWGSTVNGELGLGGIEDELILSPQELQFTKDIDIAQVSCGENHTLLVAKGGQVYSCGSNDFGQLGHEKSCKKFQLIDQLESFVIVRAACGWNFSVVLDEWGRVFCWGSNEHGQLGINNNQATEAKPKIVKGLATNAARVVQISAGRQHCIALTNNGELYSWGTNNHGQLGIGSSTTSPQDKPYLISSLVGLPVAFIASGANHSLAVSKSGAVYGWGKNAFGQLGLNDNTERLLPCQLKTLRSVGVKYVSCGEDFSIFLTKDGGVFSCGAGMYGQLGHGSSNNEFLPRKVLELMGSTVTQVACGRRHTLAFVPSRGRVYAFGLGGSGQLGTRLKCNATTPQVVLGPWVSPSGVSVIKDLPSNSTTFNSVHKIFSGGDHCFATTTCFLDHIDPADYRILDKRTQILELTLEKMNECSRAKPNEAINMDLLEYLELLFNSLCCLNGSLLTQDDQHYICNSRNPGVDFNTAVACFASLKQVGNDSIQELVFSLIVSCLQILPSSLPDIEALRVYLLMPLFHQFEDPKNWESLLNPFARALSGLNGEAGKVVVEKWWTFVPNNYFERLIQVYRSVVLFLLMSATVFNPLSDGCPDNMRPSLDILDKLNACNKSCDEPKVPYDCFYVSELTERVNIPVDYVRWLGIHPQDVRHSHRIWFCDYPFLFNAEGKTLLLETDASIQMHTAMSVAARRAFATMFLDPSGAALATPFLALTVSRENIVQDTIRELIMLESADLKKPLKVKFLNEEAEDAGGVRKEFFLLLMSEILDPKYGMFRQYEETRTIWFSEDSLEEGVMYYLIGILCGLAIYNFTIINLPFPLVLYKKLLKERVTLQDLKGLSPTLAKSFQDLLDYTADDVKEVFALNFEVSREVFGEIKTIPLKDGGGNIPVTQENKVEFVNLYVDLLLNSGVESPFVSFDRGFHKVCGGKCLNLFHSVELMALVVGNENYDWVELERITEYKGSYNSTNLTIQLFWEVFHELSLEDKKKFLLFLTGSDRIPIQGMKAIKITIQPTTDDKFLPVAHTCFNLLDLPQYKTKEKLRYKLLQAIQQHLGFSLV